MCELSQSVFTQYLYKKTAYKNKIKQFVLQTTASVVDTPAEAAQTVKSDVPVVEKKVDEKELQKQKEREESVVGAALCIAERRPTRHSRVSPQDCQRR